MAGLLTRLLIVVAFALAAAQGMSIPGAPGTLDPSFGRYGKSITHFGFGNDFAFGVAHQSDGKILVAGGCWNGTGLDLCVKRLRSDGTLDPTYGSNGKTVAPISADGLNYDSLAYSALLQPDGKLLVTGRCRRGNASDPDFVRRFCVARFTGSGQLDTSFNASGFAVLAILNKDDTARAVGLRSDGKIVLAGYCLNVTRNRIEFCLARYTSAGALDTTFNATGILPGTLVTQVLENDFAVAMAVQPDDKLVVAGSCWNGTNYVFCTVRYTADGVLDDTFNSSGKVFTPISSTGQTQGLALALQPDGKIIVGGSSFEINQDRFAAARYTTGGTLDSGFAGGGILRTSIGPGNDVIYGIAVSPDGRIVLAGNCTNNLAGIEGGYSAFCAQRFNSDGAQDLAFGNAADYRPGSLVTQMSCPACGNDSTSSATLQRDGKLVIAGSCQRNEPGVLQDDFCVARYDASATPVVCNLDIDQDGSVRAATDGLMILRRLLGLTGAALVTAAIDSNGLRTDADQIASAIDSMRTNLSLDLDGSGDAPAAARDGVMLLRAMFGFKGSAITNGAVSGAPPRSNWTQIRDHLNATCATQFAM